ncbi:MULTISPECIES: Lrp/AsnC family transcriptional regulator [unclassified Leisingera]|uniref:Lrp/AsnC family transcriptional regulator n=1 Tax=unclassified Leisingera TaxID=2614906 RepID=UPI0008030A51|nr:MULTISPECIES: Lrp/AsnC family transcriptional regulator [unclassified Leisingera]NSY41607.1 winged helix-turn-helix transcriptional regulator [Leisingera sp. ANG59]OBY26155.1 AsnC family transcriptional regulator [Leisingera sp. JC1]
MDRLDIRILDALQDDASLTQAELAEKVGSTPSTCIRRVNALRRGGYLEKSVFLASSRRLERRLKAIISVATNSHGANKMADLVARMLEEPAINATFGTTGDVDAIVIGNFVDLEDYHGVCERLFDNDPYIERYTTYFVVKEFKNSTRISTDELARKTSETA